MHADTLTLKRYASNRLFSLDRKLLLSTCVVAVLHGQSKATFNPARDEPKSQSTWIHAPLTTSWIQEPSAAERVLTLISIEWWDFSTRRTQLRRLAGKRSATVIVFDTLRSCPRAT
jgi:hypothetical protein